MSLPQPWKVFRSTSTYWPQRGGIRLKKKDSEGNKGKKSLVDLRQNFKFKLMGFTSAAKSGPPKGRGINVTGCSHTTVSFHCLKTS